MAIAKGLLIVADNSGLVHCFDAKTGQRYWSYDNLEPVWASPLIVDDTIYVVDDFGNVSIFRLAADPEVAMRKLNLQFQPQSIIEMDAPIYSSPCFANGMLYLASRTTLFLGSALVGLRASDGKLLWTYRGVVYHTANSHTPIVLDDHLLVGIGYGSGLALLKRKTDGNTVTVEQRYNQKHNLILQRWVAWNVNLENIALYPGYPI